MITTISWFYVCLRRVLTSLDTWKENELFLLLLLVSFRTTCCPLAIKPWMETPLSSKMCLAITRESTCVLPIMEWVPQPWQKLTSKCFVSGIGLLWNLNWHTGIHCHDRFKPVLDPPEIEVDQSWIRTGDGIEAEVSCNVHAEPRAEVRRVILHFYGPIFVNSGGHGNVAFFILSHFVGGWDKDLAFPLPVQFEDSFGLARVDMVERAIKVVIRFPQDLAAQ